MHTPLEAAYVPGQKPADLATVLLIDGMGPEEAAEDNQPAMDVLATLHYGYARLTAHGSPNMRIMISFVIALCIAGSIAHAQHQYPTAEVPTSEPAYLAKVKTAAPEPIVSKATIVMTQEGKPRELQAGNNGFTCLIAPDGTPLCADQNAMAWLKSVGEHTAPPDTIGFIYMLAGDTGTTNHDPHQKDTRQHWVQTGPHVMIVGPRVRDMMGYPRTADVADANQPYAMYPGTPYEHLMLPTK